MTPAGPPPWAVWLLVTLVPRRHRDILSGDVMDRYRDQILPARGRPRANRWFVAQTVQCAWAQSRWALLVVLLSFLVGDGLHAKPPEGGSTLRSWLTTTGPAWALGAVAVRTGWRTGAWAALITGGLAAGVGTAAILVLTTVTLAIAQPQLMKIGMSWESLRDLGAILGGTTLTGTTVAAAGGLVGALATRVASASAGPSQGG